MREIHLHGSLGDRFGGPFSLEVRDPAEAIRALSCQLEGFKDAILAGQWQVVRGELDAGRTDGEDTLTFALARRQALHILPAVGGAKGGAGKAILGVAMVGAAFATGGLSLAGTAAFGISSSTLAIAGGALALTGVSTMLATTAQTGSYESSASVDERPSFLFDGPVNNSAQGLAVPVIYGEINTGSIVASSGLSVEQLPADE
ncbi:hypothetical protein GY26_15955 [Gammaproteobacteria bacterium MFB021]|nr:hypothetical protein GY26_15955 [Gammaproteobacteria bacterium MFB021]